MIEIFLSENYDKGLLKAELKWIKETASRELTYTIDHFGKDVNIKYDTSYTKDETQKISSFTWNKDNVFVFIAETWIHEYLNGELIGVDSLEEYIKEM